MHPGGLVFSSWMTPLMSTIALASSGGPGPDAPFSAAAVARPFERAPQSSVRVQLQPAIDDAAAEFGVPAVLLSALVWEASHYDPHLARQWAGHGPLDLRDDRQPSVESAAALLGISA